MSTTSRSPGSAPSTRERAAEHVHAGQRRVADVVGGVVVVDRAVEPLAAVDAEHVAGLDAAPAAGMSGCQRLWPTMLLVGELLRGVERENDLGHATASVRAGHLWPALSSSIPVRKLGGRGDHVKNTGRGPRALRSPSCSERSSSRSTSSCPMATGRACGSTPSAAARARRSCCCTASRSATSCGTASRPELAREHTVVAADLRGYGDSDRPEAGADHAGYSFRAMAADQVALMAALGSSGSPWSVTTAVPG